MAALGWPLLAVRRDVDLAGLRSRPPDGKDVLDGDVWVQGIREGGHRGGGDLVVFQEELKGILQPVGEAEWWGGMSRWRWDGCPTTPSSQPRPALAVNNKHCLGLGCWSMMALNGGQGCWSMVTLDGKDCWSMVANASC